MNIAFIPARGGSKSIPLKNIKEINGKPLIYWTSKAAEEAKCIDKIIIATENEKIKETTRETSRKIDLYDNIKLMLNEKLCLIKNDIKLRPRVTLTYFVKDNKKKGGCYKTITDNVKVVDEVYKRIILIDNTIISFDNIIDIKL